LIVEDQAIVSEDLKSILIKHEFEIVGVAETGLNAISMTKEHLPDIILMDIMLEGSIDGIQVAEKIRELNIPIVYLTAYSDNERLKKAKLTEPFGYLIKPFRERELIATLQMAAYKHSIEKEMKRNLDNFQRIFNNIQDIYFEVDVQGTILQISPSIENHSSYSPDFLIGKRIQKFFYRREDISLFFNKLTKDLSLQDYPLSFKDKDGSQITCLCSATCVQDNPNNIKIVGSIKNISEVVASQKALKRNLSQFNTLLESSEDAITLYDESGFFVCNNATLKMFYASVKDHILFTHPENLSPPYQPDGSRSVDRVKQIFKDVKKVGFKDFEWTFRRFNGEDFLAKVWLRLLDLEGKEVIQSIYRDLTPITRIAEEIELNHLQTEEFYQSEIDKQQLNIEHKNELLTQKDQDLKQAIELQKFYDALFENLPIETIAVNKKGEIVRFNRAVEKNRSRSPRIGSVMYKDYAAKHDIDMYGNLIDCINSGRRKRFSDLVYKDKVWDITIAPYEHGAIITSQDITSRKKTEEQLLQLNSTFENLGSDANLNIDLILKQAGKILNLSSILLTTYNDVEKSIFSSWNVKDQADNILQLVEQFEIMGDDVLIIEDFSKSEPNFQKLDNLFKSVICRNVRLADQKKAVLWALDIKPHSFSEQEKHIFSTFAKMISIESERLSYANYLKKIALTQRLLLQSARSINSSLDFHEVAERITKEAMELLDAYGSAVYLLEKDGETLRPFMAIDPDYQDEILNTNLSIYNSFTGKAIINRQVMIFNDAGDNSNGFQIPGTSQEDNEKIIAAPLMAEDKILGAICLNKIGSNFTSADAETMEILANHATTALINAETYVELQNTMDKRLQAELQRDESESQLKSLQQNVPVGIFRVDHKAKVVSANLCLLNMLDCANCDEIKPFHALFADKRDFDTIHQELQKNKIVDDMEVRLKDSQNRVFWALVSIKPILDEKGKMLYADGIINDISKRKAAEIDLLKMQTRLATIFDNVQNIVLFETGGENEFITENVELMLGYPATEFQRNPDFYKSIILEEDLQHFQTKYEKWCQSGKSDLLTTWSRIRKADNSYIWIEDRRVETVDAFGNRFESGVRIDITNLKNADEELKKSFEKLQKLLAATVNGLVSAVEMRDPYTAGHQRRVAALAKQIAVKMNLSKDDVEGLYIAALVHDIGKINVPAEILSKPGRLTDSEFNLIKLHPQTGYDILKTIDFPWPVAEIVLQHQERFDGSSYPQGLKGEEINILARILCVADVMEAMSSHRPYRPSLGINNAIEELKNNRGVMYDPLVVDACLDLVEKDGFKFPDDV
jgi:PAS domain S-box-containing protein